MADFIGTIIDRYQIIEKLGEGGMAAVYKAYDTRLERQVAFKIMRADRFPPVFLDNMRQRFEREAKSLAQLTHPNIVPIIDYGTYQGNPFLVMAYLPGGTLKDVQLNYGKLPWSAALRLLMPLAEALHYAHEHGILHRDVKPTNILLTKSGQPMLTDFGLVKLIGVEESHTLTSSGVGVGTPGYMSPEQGIGKEVDERTDVYGLGVVLYELLTGLRPYQADTPAAVLIKQVTEPLPNPKKYVSDLPEPVVQVLFKSLAKNKEDRYRDMGEMRETLAGSLNRGAYYPTSEKKVQFLSTPSQKQDENDTLLRLKEQALEAVRKGDKNSILEKLIAINKVERAMRGETNSQFWTEPYGEPEWVTIPAGEFWIGDDNSKDDDEKPAHKLYLPEYQISRVPITNAQYALFIKATGYQAPSHFEAGRPPKGKESHPVVNVNWYEALAYCEWLSKMTGKSITLPSEAEWEKAARGDKDKRTYPWGDEFDALRCNTDELGLDDTSPVGIFLEGASPYGVLDMNGNVWEWTRSFGYDVSKYPYDPKDGREDLSRKDVTRALRGDSFYGDVDCARCAFRDQDYPNNMSEGRGVRVVLSPQTVRKFLTEADERYGTSGTYIDVRLVAGNDYDDDDRRYELFKIVYDKVGLYGLGIKGVEANKLIDDLMWLDMELALAGCNILNYDETELVEFENKKVKDPKKMRVALRSLGDYLLLEEIHTCILEVNRQWEIPEWEE
jgi:serine/threonine protein kinase